MEPPTQLVKVSNEGTASPFIARIFCGLLSLRDDLHLLGVPYTQQPAARSAFDASFKPVFEAAQATRDAARETLDLVFSHIDKVTTGEVVKFQSNQYDILESINTPLGQAFDKLIDQSIVATKGTLQPLLRDVLELDIGWFFQRDPQFGEGIADLQSQGDLALATYLNAARAKWHSTLQELRAKHEHEAWTLPGLKYTLAENQRVSVGVPVLFGLPVHEYARMSANRVLLFIENLIVHSMARKCKAPLFVVEIPPNQRDPASPVRFRLAPNGLDPSSPWEIQYVDGQDFV